MPGKDVHLGVEPDYVFNWGSDGVPFIDSYCTGVNCNWLYHFDRLVQPAHDWGAPGVPGKDVNQGVIEISFCGNGTVPAGLVAGSVGMVKWALQSVPIVGSPSAALLEWLVPATA